MPNWYTLLEGSREDASHVRRLFSASRYDYDEIDGKFALAAPAFETCVDHKQVLDLALELVASLNVALRLSIPQYAGFQLHGLIERRDGKINRFMLASGISYGISGAEMVAVAGSFGKPARTREERLVSLFAKQSEFQDIAKFASRTKLIIRNTEASFPVSLPVFSTAHGKCQWEALQIARLRDLQSA